MKVLKRAEQKNVLVNRDYYTIDEINCYLDEHIFFTFNEKLEVSYEHITSYTLEDRTVRLFLEDVTELKVIYNREFQCYTNVAVLNNGTNIYVEL